MKSTKNNQRLSEELTFKTIMSHHFAFEIKVILKLYLAIVFIQPWQLCIPFNRRAGLLLT